MLVYHISVSHPLLEIGLRMICCTAEVTNAILRSVIDHEGEGIILRKFGSEYEPGKSSSLVKIKRYAADAEALIVRADATEYELQLPNGNMFNVARNSGDHFLVGHVVTFAFAQQTAHHPLEPTILAVREDVAWGDIADQGKEVLINEGGRSGDVKRLRRYLEKYAKDRDFSPLVADNWFNVSRKDIMESDPAIYSVFRRSFTESLIAAFPELRHDVIEHANQRKTNSRREFLLSFAQQKGFSPLEPKNWYDVLANPENDEQMRRIPMIRSPFFHRNVRKAIGHTFPDIGFDYFKSVKKLPKGHWKDETNQRECLTLFARQKGFEPLVATNWYQFLSTSKNYDELRHIPMIASHFNQNVRRAIMHAFPDIGFDRTKTMKKLPRDHWEDETNRRECLSSFAKQQGFSPLIASNWYRFLADTKNYKAMTGISMIQAYYAQNVRRAIEHTFPDIGFDHAKSLRIFTRHYWADADNRRQFLTSFARQHGFDALRANAWYKFFSQSKNYNKLARTSIVVVHYKRNARKAVKETFPDIGFDHSKSVQKLPRSHWDHSTNRRECLSSYARQHAFDPLLPADWYNFLASPLNWHNMRNIPMVRTYFNRAPRNAIQQTFPDIGFDPSKSLKQWAKNAYWNGKLL